MGKFKIKTDEKGKILDQLKIKDNIFIVIQERKYGKREFIDIRKWISTNRYEGFTPKGIAIEKEFVKPLGEKLLKLKL